MQVMSVIDTTDLATYTRKSLDSGIASIVVAAVNDFIKTTTGRLFDDTEEVIERTSLRQTVWLKKQDVTAIEYVKYGYPNQTQTTAASSEYYFDSLGKLQFTYTVVPRVDYIEVKYTRGIEDVPDMLKQAALGIAASMYNWAYEGQKDAASVTVGSYRVDYTSKQSTGSDPAKNTADLNFQVIQSYRAPRV